MRLLRLLAGPELVLCLCPCVCSTKALQADFQAAVKAGATGDSSKGSAAKKTAGLGSTGISDTTYAVSFMTQLWVVLQRQITLMLRNRSTTIGRLMQCIIMGIFTGASFSPNAD